MLLCNNGKAWDYSADKGYTILNPGQIPIIAFDVPLFALAKLVQWK